MSGDAPAGRPVKEIAETDKLKRRLQQLEVDLQAAERRAARQSMAADRIVDAVRLHLAQMPPLEPPPPPTADRRKKRELVGVLHCSDWHVGELTDSYDTTVARARVERLTANTIEIAEALRSAHPIRELRVYMGGDIVEHESKRPGHAFEVDSPLYSQATDSAPRMIAGMLRQFLATFEKVSVHTIPGNHGQTRVDQGAHHSSSWDNVAYRCAQLMCCEDPSQDKLLDRLDFKIHESWRFVDRIYGWGNLVIHGNEVRGGMAGHPWYGFSRKAQGWLDTIPEPWDYLWAGHFHTLAEAVINYHQFFSNGTLSSGNQYALQQLAAAGHPVQRLGFFSEPLGLIYNCPVFASPDRCSQTERWKGWKGQEGK